MAEPLVAPGFWTGSFTLQPDGKIVIAGYSADEYAVARLMPDGSLDPSFDGDSGTGNGIVTTPMTPGFDQPSGVAVDELGRIVVAGETGADDVGVARYLSDGKLDKSLAGDGTLIDLTPTTEDVLALAIVDGGLLVAGGNGNYDSFVYRYNDSGGLDPGFSQLGRRVVDYGVGTPDRAATLAVQSDGTIVVGLRIDGPTSNPPDSVVALTPGGRGGHRLCRRGKLHVGRRWRQLGRGCGRRQDRRGWLRRVRRRLRVLDRAPQRGRDPGYRLCRRRARAHASDSR